MFKLFQTDKAQEAEDKEQRRKEKELKKKEKEEKKREKELQKEKRKSFTSPEPDRDGESSSTRKLKSEARNEDSPMKLRESTSSSTANTSKAESSPESSKMESVVGPTNSSVLQEPQPTTNNPPSYETFVAAAAATIPKLENNLSNDSSELAEEPKKDIIAEVKQKAIENLQPKASVKVSQLFLDSVQLRFLVPSAFGFGFFVAYFFGYIGFPLFGVLIVMWCFQKIDNLRQDREWIAKFNMLENERKRKEQEIASNSSKESVEWMNTVVDKFWERVSPTVIAIVMEQTKQAIEKQFAQSKPAGLSDLVLEDMDLGTTPPRINFMKSYQGLSKDVYQLDVSYSYAGEIRVVVTVKVGFGLAAIPVPILVDNISISGLAKIELQLAHQVPFIKKLKLQLQDSDMDVSVHPLKALDVLNLPLLHDWILNTVSKALENTVIEVDLMPDDKCGKLQTEDEKRGNKLTSAVSSVGKGFVAVGEGVGKGVVAVGEGFVAVGEGFGKGAVTVGKGMVTGVEEVGKGVGKVGSTLGKGVGKMGRGVGKIGKKVVTLGKSQDGSDEEDEEIDQAQSETSQPVGTI